MASHEEAQNGGGAHAGGGLVCGLLQHHKEIIMKDENEKSGKGTGVGAVLGAVTGGAAGGVTTGALVGGLTGPVGAAIGAGVGALVGAATGKKADPDVEENYWRENHTSRPYARKDVDFEHYRPAYRTGVESYSRNPGRSFDEVEPEMRSSWTSTRGRSSLEWEHARPAARDAWDRVSNTAERIVPGDSDRDGR